jgi:hypothetical protein
MARTMVDEHRTPRHFWAEAINSLLYFKSNLLTLALEFDPLRASLWTPIVWFPS